MQNINGSDNSPTQERINKWLSRMGICSRREADRLLQEGKIQIDGRVAQMGERVRPGQQVVCDGRMVGGPEGTAEPEPVLLAVNKPRGIVCTTSDRDRAENIVEFLNYPQRVYPVGRLDKDSEGLLLMTNQGSLVNKIMRGGNAHEKEYIVTVDGPVTQEFVRRMASGVRLEELDVLTRPCRVRRLDETRFSIVLTQGLNRQIRRMCQACGRNVIRLKRVRIMNIRLDGLKTGAFREVKGEELKKLRRLLEGSSERSVKERLEQKKERPGTGTKGRIKQHGR